jgi:hypothetical protein
MSRDRFDAVCRWAAARPSMLWVAVAVVYVVALVSAVVYAGWLAVHTV